MDKPHFHRSAYRPRFLRLSKHWASRRPRRFRLPPFPFSCAEAMWLDNPRPVPAKRPPSPFPPSKKSMRPAKAVQVLILCPTRELATQVAEEVHKLTAFKRGIHAVPIYGGASYDRQFYELNKGFRS